MADRIRRTPICLRCGQAGHVARSCRQSEKRDKQLTIERERAERRLYEKQRDVYMQEAKHAEEAKFQQQREESLKKVNMDLGKLPAKDNDEQTKKRIKRPMTGVSMGIGIKIARKAKSSEGEAEPPSKQPIRGKDENPENQPHPPSIGLIGEYTSSDDD